MHSEAIVIPTTSAWAAIRRISAGVSKRGPDRLPVDAAVAQRLAAARSRPRALRARQRGSKPGARWARSSAKIERPRCRAMKSSGQSRLPTASSALQRADRADRQHPVAALLGQRPQVGGVVDLVGEDVGAVGAVALDDRRPVLGRRRRDLLAARAERVAAEDHRQSSHRADPTAVVLCGYRKDNSAALIRGGLKAAAASSWSTIGSG